MRIPNSFSFLLTITFSSSILYFIAAATPPEDILPSSMIENVTIAPSNEASVDNICQYSIYPDKCKSTIQYTSPNLSSTNAIIVVKIHLKATHKNTLAAQKEAIRSLEDPKTNIVLVKTCIETYKGALHNTKMAIKAFENKDEQLVSYLKLLSTSYNECEQGFKDANVSSPFARYAETNNYYVGNCLSIYKKVWRTESEQQTNASTIRKLEDVDPSPAPLIAPNIGMHDVVPLKDVCDRTNDSSFCMSAIQSVAFEPLGSTNILDVLKLAIKASIFNTQTTIDKIKVSAKELEIDEQMKTRIYNCLDYFQSSFSMLDEANQAIGSNDGANVVNGLTKVMDTISKCNDHQQIQVIPEDERMLKNLASNSLGIAKIIWPQKQ